MIPTPVTKNRTPTASARRQSFWTWNTSPSRPRSSGSPKYMFRLDCSDGVRPGGSPRWPSPDVHPASWTSDARPTNCHMKYRPYMWPSW